MRQTVRFVLWFFIPCFSGTAQDIQGTIQSDQANKSTLEEPLIPTSPENTFENSDHVAKGVGLRNMSEGGIELAGIPSEAKINKAYLYWGWTEIVIDFPSEVHNRILFHRFGKPAVKVRGTLIGTGASLCWWSKFGSNAVFRADVTPLVRKNGLYVVKLLPKSTTETRGNSPYVSYPPVLPGKALAEGASLLVVYSNDSDGTKSTTKIYDTGLSGMFIAGKHSYYLTDVPPGFAYKWSMGAMDGQNNNPVWEQGTLGWGNNPGTGKVTTINGIIISGPGGIYNDSDWNGSDGAPLNMLYDTHSHTIFESLPSITRIDVDTLNDCVAPTFNAITVYSHN